MSTMEETANFKFEKPPAIIIGCGGTGQEIVPILSVDGKTLGSGEPGLWWHRASIW